MPPAHHRISKFLRPAQRYDDFELIRITCKAACHGKTEHDIFVKLKKTEQNCCCPHCLCHHLGYSVPPAHHRISKFLRPAQRYDAFKLIRITCRTACHGKIEHDIFIKLKKPSKTAVVLIAGVTISGTPCPRHITVPFGVEAPSGHVAQAKLNMTYLSSLKNRAKLLLSSWPVSPSRVLRAPGTSPYHLVSKHLRTTWPRLEQSHLLPEACSPNGNDNRQQRQRRTKRPPPEPSDVLKRFRALYDDKLRYYKKKVSK